MKKIIYLLIISFLSINLYSNTKEDAQKYFNLANKNIKEGKIVESTRYFTLACDNNHAVSCYYLGTLYSSGGLKEDKKGKEYYKKSCDLGSKEGCTALTFYFFKLGDKDAGMKASEKGCELKSLFCCEALMNDATKRNDEKDILKYYTKACKLDSTLGCYGLGLIYAQGRHGIKKDKEKSLEYLYKSCKGGYPKACEEVLKIERLQKPSKEETKLLRETLEEINQKTK